MYPAFYEELLRAATTASVNSDVDAAAAPSAATSRVRISVSANTLMTAFSIASARSSNLRYLSISTPPMMVAVRFAICRPGRERAECLVPCSNMAPLMPMLAPGKSPRSTEETSGDVCDNVAVQIWQNHDIKLLRVRSHLHARVVHNHGFKLNKRILAGNVCAALKEQAVCTLHYL
ncbi:unnamed protein product [Chondrus crispus]|uniref:Uncharacterized protein n=1 Tax=Chondrus crispus TaxID=2769 RepID=R7QNE9_CHOCR|nr:unnamed protein product [Chondrus crispus]CDF39629.1 unnamed protein product [Chondrus crispus]|eukprot:XP_005709923.1 unnamed protein product [Chondrus crispus]